VLSPHVWLHQRCNSYTPIARNLFNRACFVDDLSIFNARDDGVMRLCRAVARPVHLRAAQSRFDREVSLMAHASSAHFTSSAAGARHEVPEVLFKADRPREIDRFIDYFGGASDTASADDEEGYGAAALERPA
jgi:hypothetical protein